MATALLVDDEIEILESVANMLTPMGWDLVRCSNGDDAAAMARVRRFDVVLSDVVMEGLVGTALLDAIHATTHNEGTPVVFMSSMAERRVRHIIDGHYAFIPKPVDARQLRSVLERVLGADGEGALHDPGPGAGRTNGDRHAGR